MNKFKFGDVVRHKSTNTIFCVFTKQRETPPEKSTEWAMMLWARDSETLSHDDMFFMTNENCHEFELIPHPDTARLDWIEETFGNNAMLVLKAGAGRTYRQAIDKAMQSEKSKKGLKNE